MSNINQPKYRVGDSTTLGNIVSRIPPGHSFINDDVHFGKTYAKTRPDENNQGYDYVIQNANGERFVLQEKEVKII